MPERIKTVTIVGAGNVAWHLASVINRKGFRIKEIISRSAQHAKDLAGIVHARHHTNAGSIGSDPDLIIVAVPDAEIENVLHRIKQTRSLVVHTSGSTSINVFGDHFTDFGVFYPFQTFTKGKPVEFSTVPLCIETNSEENTEKLKKFALPLTPHVLAMDSPTRLNLHIAAVFACNFSNHMYAIAEHIAHSKGIDFSLLMPLIIEAASKIKEISPLEAQTGPAVRYDTGTLEKHLELLADHPDLQHIYKIISENIQQFARGKV